MFEETAPGKQRSPSIESPRVYREIRPEVGTNGRSIITLSDGSSFLTEYTTGEGHLLLFSVEANIGWSDFPVKGLFAPLLHRATVYLAGGNQNTSTGIVGEVIKVVTRLKRQGTRDVYSFESPGGFEQRIIPQTNVASGMSVFESAPTTESGVYELRSGKNPIHATAMNINPGESDLHRATDSDQARFWQKIGVNYSKVTRIQTPEKLETAVVESRLGIELWKYVIVAAILVALIEMAVAREAKSVSTAKTPA